MPETPADFAPPAEPGGFRIRDAVAADIARVAALDETITGMAKPDYWEDIYRRFGGRDGRYLLIAEAASGSGPDDFLGFIVGEVRSWEFGSPPGGWVLTLGVRPDNRVQGIGTRLFDAVCARLRAAGVTKVRTMIARDDMLNMSFFRAQGLMAGSFIELEMPLD